MPVNLNDLLKWEKESSGIVANAIVATRQFRADSKLSQNCSVIRRELGKLLFECERWLVMTSDLTALSFEPIE